MCAFIKMQLHNQFIFLLFIYYYRDIIQKCQLSENKTCHWKLVGTTRGTPLQVLQVGRYFHQASLRKRLAVKIRLSRRLGGLGGFYGTAEKQICLRGRDEACTTIG